MVCRGLGVRLRASPREVLRLQLVLQYLLHVMLYDVRVVLRNVWHLRNVRLRQHLRRLRMQRLHGQHGCSVLLAGNGPGGYHCAVDGANRAASPGAEPAAGAAANHRAGPAASHDASRDARREIATASPS